MTNNITLNASNVVGNTNSQFQYNFISSMLDVPEGSEIQLSSLTYPYSMQNVSSTLGNNSFGYNTSLPTSTISNIYNTANVVADVNNANPQTASTGTGVNSVVLNGVQYLNGGVGMALNIPGATGFTSPLLVTSVTATSGTVTATLNQTVNLPSIGTFIYIWYVNATQVCVSASSYIFPGYCIYYNSPVGPFSTISSVSANTGSNIIITFDRSTPYNTDNTALGTLFCVIAPVISGSSYATTFVGTFSNNPLLNTPYINASSWTGLDTTYGSPVSGSLTNISLISGSLYKVTLPSYLRGSTYSAYVGATYNQTYYPVLLSNGFYTINDINNALQATMYSNGHYWYNSNPINIQGTITASSGGVATLTATGIVSQIDTLPIGSTVYGNNGTTPNFFFGTISGVTSANVYSLSNATGGAITTAQPFAVSNNNEVTNSIIYPLSISTNANQYTNVITAITIPTQANIQSVFGVAYYSASGYDGTIAWKGTYPTSSGTCFQITIPTTTNITTTIGNILGFIGGSYPATASGLTVASVSTSGNSLTASPPFTAQGSTVNAIVVKCNLVENSIKMPSDILQVIPITSTYGSNINFLSPNSNTLCKMRPGKHRSITISLTDQNGNLLNALDPTCLITLLIKSGPK